MLSALLNNPRDQTQWDVWSYNHRLSHNAIRAAILKQKNLNLSDYQIDPIGADDMVAWLERNSQLHDDMNAALGVQSVDLQDVDIQKENEREAWIFLHYQEHYTAENKLGI